MTTKLFDLKKGNAHITTLIISIVLFFLFASYVSENSNQALAGDIFEEGSAVNFLDFVPDDHYFSIKSEQILNDNGKVLTGKIRPNGPGDSDIFLVKISSNGTMQWVNYFGDEGYDDAHFVNQTGDGGFIIVGSTTGYGAFMEDVFMIKTDCHGFLEWYGRYGGINPEWGLHATATSDGGYLINGTVLNLGDPRVNDPGTFMTYLIKVNSLGTLEWDLIVDAPSER